MMTGYAIKLRQIDTELEAERYEELIDNFNYADLKTWQYFYDESGYECLVYLTDYEYEFEGAINTSINSANLFSKGANALKLKHVEELRINMDVHFFVSVWYNGTDMDTIFAGIQK